MKNKYLIQFAALILVAFILGACGKKDEFKPNLLLNTNSNGNIDVYMNLNDFYIELGATAWDNFDGEITENIEITHNIEALEETEALGEQEPYVYLDSGATVEVGEYIVTYSITDAAGNTETKERNVTIRNEMYKFQREYIITKTNLTDHDDPEVVYESDVEYDDAINNRIWFKDLGGSGNDIFADIIGDTVFIPVQTFDDDFNVKQVVEIAEGGYAGTVNRGNYGIDIIYVASYGGSSASEEFHEVFKKK
ncbi:MAG: hypothetical protein HN704_11610 [Bacteroidetes bacterium]|jgi:hypothetical protein|nr:hypothetical protein [Bacteroidota bacterium]MBT6685719.1 hypothetical protein [Bacteroidota bacterium]MBT7143514.1 hypothetical protein [Bacteroidota bacterium]MBT7492239.1 hypothetical protein [Bacteroidota bacterium]